MKLHRKMLTWMMILVMLVSLAFPAMAEETGTLPEVGETLHGFVVQSRGTFDLLGVPDVLLEHEKTGALVYYVAADDINRSFDISFRTCAPDNTGMPHVFEHVTMSGSDKYPSPNMFFPMSSQTYLTFANAMTLDNATTFPVASLSEEQLLKVADVYFDAVFHPMLYKDERLYRREAWRYELPDAEADLTITGTVYNEMKGATTLDSQAQINLARALFPDSILGNNPGGEPAEIPTLTYQALLDFHDAYYHPSNALVVLYGKLDLAQFLALMNEGYFSHYEKADIVVPNGDIPPQTEFQKAEIAFPVEAQSQTDKSSVIAYGFVANGAEKEDEFALGILASILSNNASVFQKSMREQMPGASCGVSVDATKPQLVLQFIATGVNPEDADTFQKVVDASIEQVVAEGFDAELVQAVLSSEKFSLLTLPEMPGLGPQLSVQIVAPWARNGDLDYFNEYVAAIEQLQALGDDTSIYSSLAQRYMAENPHAALVTTYPKAGLAEEQAQQLADKLAAYKASLTDEEIQKLVDQTAEMKALSEEEPPVEAIKALQAVTVETLPEEIETYDVQDTQREGVRYLTVETQSGDIGLTQFSLDTSWVPMEDLPYLSLYASLLGQLDTGHHSKEELALLGTRYLNGMSFMVDQVEMPGKQYAPMLSVSWMGLTGDDDYAAGVALVREILLETKFDNIADIASQVDTMITSMQELLQSNPHMLQLTRGQAYFDNHYAYEDYTSGLGYYQQLLDIADEIEKSPEAVVKKLDAIHDAVANKHNAIAGFVGNGDAVGVFEKTAATFFEGMSDEAREPADYSQLPVPAKREAIVIDGTVQYNMLYASLEALGIEENGIFSPLANILTDSYLTPTLRHGSGAYGVMTSFTRDGFGIISYRDPEVSKTFETYEGIGSFLRETTLAQEDLDRYIISAYASFATPQGKLIGASNALGLYIAGRDQNEKLDRMREMKTLDIEDLRVMADVFDSLNEVGIRSTSGSASIIEANKSLFDQVLRIERQATE